jgi:hypothetical protein
MKEAELLICSKSTLSWCSAFFSDKIKKCYMPEYNISENSSFSWWCAWLNNYHNKIVIAPEKWLNTDNFDFSQVIPETWIKIGTS